MYCLIASSNLSGLIESPFGPCGPRGPSGPCLPCNSYSTCTSDVLDIFISVIIF